MSVTAIPYNTPTYTCLSGDISSSKVAGVNVIGASIYVIDTKTWYVVQSDLTITPLSSSGISAGESHLGSMGGNTVVISITPTLTVHASYVPGDYVGTSSSPITFSAAARITGATGMVQSAALIDYAAQSVPAELWLFDKTVTPPADSAAWSLSDADSAYCVGVIPFTNYYASALNSVSFVNNLGIIFQTLVGSQSIFGCLVTRGAPSYASGDLTVRLSILQD